MSETCPSAKETEDVDWLRRTVAELTARCQQQASELVELRQRVKELEAQGQSNIRNMVSRGMSVECGSQTEGSADTTSEAADLWLPDFSADVQQTQLAEIHAEAGQKARELRRVQEAMRLVQRELQEQCSIADQYRNQVEVLEEQLGSALMKRRRQVGEELSDLADSCSRPMSARGCRPTSAGRCRGSIAATSVAASPRVARAWSEGGVSDAASPRSPQSCGWETQRSMARGRRSRVMDESSDEEDGS